MIIEYQLPKKKQPVFSFVKGVLKIFQKKVRVCVLGEPLDAKCLMLANHANKMGPLKYELYLPVYHATWGAHEMLEDYASRRAYLRDILYIQKNNVGRKKAAFKAWYEAFFSQFFYKGIKVLPTYPDARLIRTIKKSVDVLNSGDTGVMVFPEDSSGGYLDRINKFLPGFVLIMDKYYKVNGEDIATRPIYYHKRKRVIVVGEKYYLQDFKAQNMDKKAIAEFFKDKVNELYDRIEAGEFDQKK